MILLIALAFTVMLSISLGAVNIPFWKIPALLFSEGQGIEHTIINNLRLPRIMLGFAVGGALSLSGAILQGVFRNPLVEPYTLGISGGAALGVCFALILNLPQFFGVGILPFSGFIGAAATIVLVYWISIRSGRVKVQGMLLTGVMISFISSSIIMLLMAIANAEDLHNIIFWVMGSLDEPDMRLINIALVVAVLGLIISYFYVQPLNALRLGEEKAIYLGIDTIRSIRILFFLASLLTGISVSIAGIIGFVGLIIPHLMRMIVGTDYRILLLSSFLSGSIFLILSDTIARTIILPHELPIGVITGIIGGGVFVYVLGRKLYSEFI